MAATFSFEELAQLARSKREGRIAANLLSTKLGDARGIVQCIRAAASLPDELYDAHASHDTQVQIAALMQDRQRQEQQTTGQQNS